jgi:hypothetical protein
MSKFNPRWLAFVVLACSSAIAQAQEPRNYMDGPVTNVSYIRTEPGQFENYMNFLATTYKTLMNEYKKAGIILDWKVYEAQPRTPDEPNLILTTTFVNMGALDGLEDRQQAISSKLIGNRAQQAEAMAARGKMRTQLGSELVRELIIKGQD